MDKSALFSKNKRKSQEVTIPEVGVATVREMSLSQRLEIEKQEAKEGAPTRTALMICACTFGADGKPIFVMDDALQIDEMPIAIVAPLAYAVHEVNGTGATSAEDAKKNS